MNSQPVRMFTTFLITALYALTANAVESAKAPFPYVWGKAYHILPETTSDESGYFSLCEGRNGKMYVGTAKYGHDSFLVEFDPATEQQKIVLDTHKLCGLTATGNAAQAKIHTRNFVGPSGKIYVGSKQGYHGDTSEYPGGYVMTYDPRTGTAENLGMPFVHQGVIDTVADEARGLIYVVTCEEQHWLLYDMKARTYRELGPLLTPFATTLIDAMGRANVLNKDFQLVQFDPVTGKMTTRDIEVDGGKFTRRDNNDIPTWNLTANNKTAYLIRMQDPTLIEVDLMSTGNVVKTSSHGRLIEGKRPDSRCALSIAPDGSVYAVVSVDNTTGFGTGRLHHLLRFDPKSNKTEDLGVLAVKNPEFFDFSLRANGKPPPWSHGYHKLPDGTLTPLHHHMALVAASDGTLYVTILYPFTLLRIDQFKMKGSS